MSTNTVRADIVAYLERFIPVAQVADTDDIFKRGFVSSMFAMQLVAFIEDHFALQVDNDDLDLDNFRSISALTRFVESKRSVGVA